MVTKAVRRAVYERDGWRCRECGTRRRLSVDHVVSEGEGGTDDFANLQTLCVPCNARKGPHPTGPKTGRPRVPRRRRSPLTIRVTETLKSEVVAAAREADQSVGEWIVESLSGELARLG